MKISSTLILSLMFFTVNCSDSSAKTHTVKANGDTTSPVPSMEKSLAFPVQAGKLKIRATATAEHEYFGCSSEQLAIVNQSWAEASLLAAAHNSWMAPNTALGSEGLYQPAMSMYMGTDTAKDAVDFGSRLKMAIQRQALLYSSTPFSSYQAKFYCEEASYLEVIEPTQSLCDNGTPAYTTTTPLNSTYHLHELIFCPLFFAPVIFSFEVLLAAARQVPALHQVIDPWVDTRPAVLFHETHHWFPTATSYQYTLSPEQYFPKDVYDLAKYHNLRDAEHNAQSYVAAAVAIYIQQTFSVEDPPPPKAYASPELQADPILADYSGLSQWDAG